MPTAEKIIYNNIKNKLPIDPEAKTKIDLNKHTDGNGATFYTGKLQFPGIMQFDNGASFMVFTSEPGYEQLQIAPLEFQKKRQRTFPEFSNGKWIIPINPLEDKNNNTYYVGEVLTMGQLDLREGIFFTIFISKEGNEEIQISKLRYVRRQLPTG